MVLHAHRIFTARLAILVALLLTAWVCVSSASAALSGNIVHNAGFEDQSLSGFKTAASIDSGDVVIPTHRFDRDNDVQRWLGIWGPPSQGLGGFSLYDDPRDLAETGGDTQATGDLGNLNNSIDPYDAGNRILENVMFRPTFTQWIEAPAHHVAGPIRFSMDFFISLFSEPAGFFEVHVYGSHELPAQNTNWFDGPELAYPGSTSSTLDADPLVEFNWWYHWERDGQILSDVNDKWSTFTTEDTSLLWDFDGSVKHFGGLENYADYLVAETTEAYEYFVVTVYSATYGELNPYFFVYGGKIVDDFTMAFDNVNLQVSVALPGDFDDSGVVDTQDINPFILALTDPAGYEVLYGMSPVAHDINGDGLVNTEDINAFIVLLTGGGGATILPEPAGFGLLALGGLVALRQRNQRG